MTVGRLQNKVAVVTGGSRGMGEAYVRCFVAEGARVVFTDIDTAGGQALSDELGPSALFVHHDVSEEDSWRKALERGNEAFGLPTILVNNAGIVIPATIDELDLDSFNRLVAVNQVSVFLGMKAIVPYMRKAGGGSIVNISSALGLIGSRGQIGYTATKFAVRGMTKAAALELGPDGIRVNSVHPGSIRTPIQDGLDQEKVAAFLNALPINRFGEPDEVANMVLFLASDESSYCTGSEFIVDGGWIAQ